MRSLSGWRSFLDWVITDQDVTGSGYETDTSIPLVAFLAPVWPRLCSTRSTAPAAVSIAVSR